MTVGACTYRHPLFLSLRQCCACPRNDSRPARISGPTSSWRFYGVAISRAIPPDLFNPSRPAPTSRWQSKPGRQRWKGQRARRCPPSSCRSVSKSSSHSLVSYLRPHATPVRRQAPCRADRERRSQAVIQPLTGYAATTCGRRRRKRHDRPLLLFRRDCPLMLTTIAVPRRIGRHIARWSDRNMPRKGVAPHDHQPHGTPAVSWVTRARSSRVRPKRRRSRRPGGAPSRRPLGARSRRAWRPPWRRPTRRHTRCRD